jgi:Phospholipase_D-nuclease N-terminal
MTLSWNIRLAWSMATTKRWSDLTGAQQKAIVVVAALEMVVTASALIDLARRPARQVRGPKQLWLVGCFVQPVGPIAYLALGRRPD